LFAALTVLAIVALVRALAPQTLGETARRQLLFQLQDHYRGYTISIRRGHYDPQLGLVFDDLRIVDDSSSYRFRPREMVRVERLTVVADVHPEKLLDQQVPLRTRRIVMDGVQANVWLSQQGQVSLSALLPLPSFGPVVPRIDMRGVKLRLLSDAPRSRPVDAELEQVVLLNNPNPQGGIDKTISIRGSTDFANDLILRIDTQVDATDLRCSLKGAYLSRDLIERLPDAWADSAAHLKHLQCVCDATLAMRRTAGGPWNYRLRTTIHDGQLDHPLLPMPLTQLRGILACDPQGLSIESSQGTLGDAVIRLTGRIDGHRWPCQADLHLVARGLLLDDRLASALPGSLQASWDRLQPLGRVDIDARLVHADSRWNTQGTIICNGVDIRYEKFPYPVENLVGRVEIRDGIAAAQSLDGRIGGNRMQCAFRMPILPGITNEKSFILATDGPIPVDKLLLSALSPRGSPMTGLESFVRSLNPRGSVQLANAILTSDAAGRQRRTIDLRVIDGHLRYEKFDYPLYNVSGRVEIDDQLVRLTGFRGTSANAGVVLCDGTYQLAGGTSPPPGQGHGNAGAADLIESQLKLSFRAAGVPMDESLRSSLPEATQHVWDGISPSGVLDELNVELTQIGLGNPISLDVIARQHDQQQVTSRSLSLRPTALPYRLDVTGGTVRFDGSKVIIESIRGKQGGSTLAADGLCVQDEHGRWELALNLHSGSRLHPDADLIAALPHQMREAMRALQLRGPVSLRGQTRLAMPDATHPEPSIRWDLVLQLEGNRIADVGPVHSLRGELSIKGVRDEVGIRAEGDVRIDSMHVYDLQITSIRGPFSIDNDRLHLGGQSADRKIRPGAKPRPSQQADPIQGRLFDGTLDLDGVVVLSSGDFDVGMTARDAQVPTVLADFGHSDNELTGTFTGQMQLQGNLGTTDLLKGSGAARLSGANLYKLPLIVQVLNLLRITPTEKVAFTDGQLEFTLLGDTMTFSDLQIWGDLVALHGGGTLDRNRELELTFNTRVSPQNSFTQVLRPLGSQRYTLWTIDVRGPLHAPVIERRAFEGVGETLERLFPAMAGHEPEPATRSASRFVDWFR
jgi:hypothetical protein